jgi:uncharacterized protein DUF3237
MSDSSRAITRRGFAAASAAALAGFASPPPAAAQDGAGDTLRSEFLVDLVFDVATPLNLGTRQIVPVTGGTFSGPKLKGTALSGGGDWIVRRPDGVSMLNVRATLRTDDEQLIYITYDGILYVPTGASAADRYWRMTPKFETGSAKYEWLTRLVSVGVGRQVPGKAAYRVFQIL